MKKYQENPQAMRMKHWLHEYAVCWRLNYSIKKITLLLLHMHIHTVQHTSYYYHTRTCNYYCRCRHDYCTLLVCMHKPLLLHKHMHMGSSTETAAFQVYEF